jgi:transaldolase
MFFSSLPIMAPENSYLKKLSQSTDTRWWHDSADPQELGLALGQGAVGATTNPYLTALALEHNYDVWQRQLKEVLASCQKPEDKAEQLTRLVVCQAAAQLMPEFERSEGKNGWVCAQVNPHRASDREAMLAMARRFTQWASNITVKLPATSAGLDVLEECAADGISATATVSFTVPQVVAIAERYRRGRQRAQARGIAPRPCFAVIMIGRLDDYLREVAQDQRAGVAESDLRQAGLAVTKRSYAIYLEHRFEATLLVAALRGTYHMTELAGAKLVMSIAPAWQEPLTSPDLVCEKRMHREVPPEVIRRLSALSEFVRSYEPEGMAPHEFVSYGVTQRTLAQFSESGWKKLENFR